MITAENIIVAFHFFGSRIVDVLERVGVRERAYDREEVDAKRVEQAQSAGKDPFHERKDRPDTGELVVDENKVNADVSGLEDSLNALGFSLQSLVYYTGENKGGKSKTVVQLGFTREPVDPADDLRENISKALHDFLERLWGNTIAHIKVWDNGSEKPMTINLVGPTEKYLPKKTLVVDVDGFRIEPIPADDKS